MEIMEYTFGAILGSLLRQGLNVIIIFSMPPSSFINWVLIIPRPEHGHIWRNGFEGVELKDGILQESRFSSGTQTMEICGSIYLVFSTLQPGTRKKIVGVRKKSLDHLE
ncbi:PREDICTED: uncharacterized protein LOC104811866 [Tarenaya hassleriana]|uniref:uncharacterized protein LOC104811866 n=1 Tax=Tarenaya hassleriana TaxID=28532 RepID=UPI00053CA1E4|nr:PREDICTED: uncharacterized protein LOC104811866 [Tarenaya hassleriana]XP_010537022.1 PREDICTED: uncharacterized protein LOC104811866 [Tarenaya hassleriana]XP_010537023.1 PREDICTED: uncharacterized protein LOC104811866 [Tarenaya hassleriana]XP_010537024.1 PREDICTED: uncharacterized protein LOC104811866 [Tarenaya hassleriana]XP_010537025.1 PREDICTED: uncharacterized protein LOC104811866 [Tarenaya hassleriana]